MQVQRTTKLGWSSPGVLTSRVSMVELALAAAIM